MVSDDNEESNTSPKGVDSDRYFREDSCDFPTCGSNNLLIGVFIGDLNRADVSSQNSKLSILDSFFSLFLNISCDEHVNLLHSANRELSGSEEKLILWPFIITQTENKAELSVSEREVQRNFQVEDQVTVLN